MAVEGNERMTDRGKREERNLEIKRKRKRKTQRNI
jgi:hypothetical protein